MAVLIKILAAAWFVATAASGARPARAGESEDDDKPTLVDWIGRFFALLGALYLFRDVYEDLTALVAEKTRPDAPRTVQGGEAPAESVGSEAYDSLVARDEASDADAPAAPSPEAPRPEAPSPEAPSPDAPVGDGSASVALLGDWSDAVGPAAAFTLVVIVVSAYLALSRGFEREIRALAIWFVALVAAAAVSPALSDAASVMPAASALDGALRAVAAFVVVFVVLVFLLGLLARRALGPAGAPSNLGRGLGFLYGAARGFVIVGLIAFALEKSDAAWPALSEATAALQLRDQLGKIAPWLAEQSELMRVVEDASR